MPKLSKKFIADLAERAGWTLAEAAVGFAITETSSLDTVYAPVIATALAALKGIIAKHIGKKDTAATLPASVDS